MNGKPTAKAAAAPAQRVTCEEALRLVAGSTNAPLYLALLPVELRAYVDALLAHHEKRVFKLLVIGDESVGKTSLVHRFTQGTFNIDCLPTVTVPPPERRTLNSQKKPHKVRHRRLLFHKLVVYRFVDFDFKALPVEVLVFEQPVKGTLTLHRTPKVYCTQIASSPANTAPATAGRTAL